MNGVMSQDSPWSTEPIGVITTQVYSLSLSTLLTFLTKNAVMGYFFLFTRESKQTKFWKVEKYRHLPE